jgi:hypothetical protein
MEDILRTCYEIVALNAKKVVKVDTALDISEKVFFMMLFQHCVDMSLFCFLHVRLLFFFPLKVGWVRRKRGCLPLC